MTNIQVTLIALAIINLVMGILNRFANHNNYEKLKEILTEEKIQSEERSKNEEETD